MPLQSERYELLVRPRFSICEVRNNVFSPRASGTTRVRKIITRHSVPSIQIAWRPGAGGRHIRLTNLCLEMSSSDTIHRAQTLTYLKLVLNLSTSVQYRS